MKLLRASFLSVRGLPDLTCDFTRGPKEVARDVVVITGPASSGKTRFLEAILAAKEVIAAYGAPIVAGPWIRPGDEAAKITLTFQLDEDEQRRVGGLARTVQAEALFQEERCFSEADDAFVALLERYAHDPQHGKFDYFPANRSVPPPGPMHGLSAIEQRIYRLGRDARKYSFLPRLLHELPLDADRLARFRGALAALCRTVEYVAPDPRDPLRCLTSKGGPPVLPSELSVTETDAVIFAATEVLVRHDRSIVLVDRPEQSADERSIVAWVEALRGLSEEPQLFLASTSPALLASVEPAAIIHLDG